VAETLKEKGLRFMQVDDEHILLGFRGGRTSLRLVLSVLEDGRYCDLRTLELARCPRDHPHLDEALAMLTRANLERKLVKFLWDPDGDEVIANACLPLADNGSLPAGQLLGFILLLSSQCDDVVPELEQVLRGGRRSGGSSSRLARPSATPPGQPPAGAAAVFALGVLLLGAAALLGVIYLFTR
jgi:hypothetical protein